MEAHTVKTSDGDLFEVFSLTDVDDEYFELVDNNKFIYRIYKKHIIWIHYRKGNK